MKRLTALLTVALLGCLLSAAIPAPGASNPIIIDVPGVTEIEASGINDAGQIVGSFTASKGHGYVRAADGTFTTIDAPGGTNTTADGINGGGQIVGRFLDGGWHVHGYVRAADGTFTTIDVPSATWTVASGINTARQIVGPFKDSKFHGYVRAADGTFTTIDVPGGTDTTADGINDASQIVGRFTDASGKGHGYVRAADGTFTTIDVPGGTDATANGINDAGQVAGRFTDASGKGHGFVRTSEGTFTTIDMPGREWTVAWGINDAGWIVGGRPDPKAPKESWQIFDVNATADRTEKIVRVIVGGDPRYTTAGGLHAGSLEQEVRDTFGVPTKVRADAHRHVLAYASGIIFVTGDWQQEGMFRVIMIHVISSRCFEPVPPHDLCTVIVG